MTPSTEPALAVVLNARQIVAPNALLESLFDIIERALRERKARPFRNCVAMLFPTARGRVGFARQLLKQRRRDFKVVVEDAFNAPPPKRSQRAELNFIRRYIETERRGANP